MNAVIRQENMDFIHCNTPVGGLLGRLAGKKCGVKKVIYQVHGFHFYKGAPLLNWLLYYPVEWLLARWTDAIITINHEDYAFAQKKMKLKKGGKVYYVPGVGIDTKAYAPNENIRQAKRQELGLSDDDVMLISAGDLNKNKNNTVLISALAKLQNKKIHYFLCGVGDKENDLRKQAEDAGISENVHFLGYRTDMKALLQAADVFVMPSFREGLSRSIMEAMSAGLPCIVSKIRGNVDLVTEGQGGYLHAPADADTAADAIAKLANDPALRQAMRQFNLEKIKSFDSSVIEQEIQKIYTELMPEQEKVTV
jgi:glycosyltransferase involved in cell wall biosynthesis